MKPGAAGDVQESSLDAGGRKGATPGKKALRLLMSCMS